jgi:ribosomal protein S25
VTFVALLSSLVYLVSKLNFSVSLAFQELQHLQQLRLLLQLLLQNLKQDC